MSYPKRGWAEDEERRMIIYVTFKLNKKETAKEHWGLTLPLRKARAATNSLGGMMLLSVSKVLITLDIGDGTERPYEFSARTMNMYVVAGFKSLICGIVKGEKKKSPFVRNNKSSQGGRVEVGQSHLRYED